LLKKGVQGRVPNKGKVLRKLHFQKGVVAAVKTEIFAVQGNQRIQNLPI